VYYVFSLVIIFFVIMTGDDVLWYEGLIMMILYAFYILMMKFNTQLMSCLDRGGESLIFSPFNGLSPLISSSTSSLRSKHDQENVQIWNYGDTHRRACR